MDKYKITLIISLATILLFHGCYKEDVTVEPDACFQTISTTVEARTGIEFTFCGDGEFIVFYSGEEGAIFNEPGSKGRIVNPEKLTLTHQYRNEGTYVAKCIATSYGDFGNEKKQDIQELSITVTPMSGD